MHWEPGHTLVTLVRLKVCGEKEKDVSYAGFSKATGSRRGVAVLETPATDVWVARDVGVRALVVGGGDLVDGAAGRRQKSEGEPC